MTGVTVLIVTLLATASVAALGINAVLLAQVISSCAFVQISAADTIRIQNETSWTGTGETSFRVLTVVLAGFRCYLAFVYVCNPKFNAQQLVKQCSQQVFNHLGSVDTVDIIRESYIPDLP